MVGVGVAGTSRSMRSHKRLGFLPGVFIGEVKDLISLERLPGPLVLCMIAGMAACSQARSQVLNERWTRNKTSDVSL